MIPIELRSVGNIRDLGGTETVNGCIRQGCLIRSAHLGYATQADVQHLRENHRLSKIIDLRTGGERTELPDHSFGVEHLKLPIFKEFKAGISHETQEKQSAIPRMEDLYRFIMTDRSSSRLPKGSSTLALHRRKGPLRHDNSAGAHGAWSGQGYYSGGLSGDK